MNLILILMILALFTFDCKKHDRGILVLGWLGQQCDSITKQSKLQNIQYCEEGKIQLWDHQSLVIRGFISSAKQLYFQQQFNFDQIMQDQALYHQLLAYSPSLKIQENSSLQLWEQMWKVKYGQKAKKSARRKRKQTNKMIKQKKEKAKHFLSDLITMYKQINAKKLSWRQFNRNSLASQLHLSRNQMLINCDLLGNIDKIGVCYIFDGKKWKTSECEQENNQFECSSKALSFKHWKIVNKDIDVFHWQESKQYELNMFQSFDSLLFQIGLVVGVLVLGKIISCFKWLCSQEEEIKQITKRKKQWNSLKL